VPAEDTEKDQDGEPTLAARLAAASMKDKHTGKLTDTIEIAVGMKAMVLVNIAVETDVANGTRGTVKDILLDPRDDHCDVEDGAVQLKYPPAMILFRPDKRSNFRFEGVAEGLIPISPSKALFTAKGKNGKKYKMTRHQYALTPRIRIHRL